MKIAVLSDIHGNPIALDAVLAHIQSSGDVDAYWFVGDYCAIGYDPVGVLKRISGLENAIFIRGNTDRFIVTNELPIPTQDDVRQNTDLLPILVEVARSFSWTQGRIMQGGWRDWLAALPLDKHLTLPDGTRVLLVHAAPGEDDGAGIAIYHTNDDLARIVQGCEVDLIIVGHTHIPLDKIIGGVRVVNPGSISNPLTPDLRASYVTINADQTGYDLTFHRVDYDREAAVSAIKRSHHPAPDYLVDYMRGDNLSPLFRD